MDIQFPTRTPVPRYWLLQQRSDACSASEERIARGVLEGDATACVGVGRRALRLFVSSTFTDTKAERNHLIRDVFPQVRRFCEQHGIHFR